VSDDVAAACRRCYQASPTTEAFMAILSLGYPNTAMADDELRLATEVDHLPGGGHVATGLTLAVSAMNAQASGPGGRYELRLTIPEALGVVLRAGHEPLTDTLG